MRGDRVHYAHKYRGEQRPDEEKGRQHEHKTGFLYPSKIHGHDKHENHQAQCQLMRVQGGYRADQRRHPGGDTHRRRQDVIDHQGRRREQAGVVAQIFTRHSEGAAPVRVGLDRLAIAEVEDRKQHQNGRKDRDQVLLYPDQTERNQQRHRLFRSVGGAGQAVETEDWDTGRYAYVLVLGIAGG